MPSKALTRTDCVFTSTRYPVTLRQAGRSPYGPGAYTQCTQEGNRSQRWMPLSVSFTLVNLPLSDCPVLSTREYVSPVSHLIDTSPARSNDRTLEGALDIQTLPSCSCCTFVCHRTPPPFYRLRSTSGLGQPSGSPRTRWLWNQKATFEISNMNINDFVVYRRSTKIFQPYTNSSRSELEGRTDRPPSAAAAFWDGQSQTSGPHKSVANRDKGNALNTRPI